MALKDDQITREAKRRTEEEKRRKKQAARSQTVAVPRGEVGSFTKAYQGYKFVEEGSPEARSAKNLGEFIETEAQRRFEAKGGAEMLRPRARTAEEESQVAREALAGRAEANRRAAATLPSPLEKDVNRTELELPGGGRVKFGSDTLRQMRGFEAKAQEEKAEQQAEVSAAQEGMYRKWYDAAQKRYDDELASRGLVAPKTRAEEAEFNAERMVDFRLGRAARESAQQEEKATVNAYKDFKRAAREARKNKDFQSAALFEKDAEEQNKKSGGNISNVTARRKFFEEQADTKLKTELERRATERRAVTAKQNSANPEATVDFTATGFTEKTPQIPVRNWTGFIAEKPEPFKRTEPERTTRIPEKGAPKQQPREIPVQPPEPKPTTFPQPEPFTPIPMTSTQRTDEDVLPGISEIPKVERLPDETPEQYNQRVIQEYTQGVILPSLDEDVQNAYTSAVDLNEQERALFRRRLISKEAREQYDEIATKAKEQHDVLKKAIDDLRKERNKFPVNSRERVFKDQQIETLRSQLGFFAKRLY